MSVTINCPGCASSHPVSTLERGRHLVCGCGDWLALPHLSGDPTDLEISVFVREAPPCPLCHEALEDIQKVLARSRVRTRLTVHPIDGSPLLRASFAEDIPVVFVDGVYRFRGRVEPALLRRLLTTAAKKDPT